MNDLKHSTQTAETSLILARKCAESMYARDRATREMGAKIADIEPGKAVLTMPVRPNMLQGHGLCHGGYIFALADSTFAFACNTYDEAMVAIGCSIDYVAPAREGDVLIATGTEQSRSGRTGNYDVRIENQEGQLIALFHGKSYRIKGPVIIEETA